MSMYVITHKKIEAKIPQNYIPLLVGANFNNSLSLNYLTDNKGKNISDKNKNFCELTGLYWLWKNDKSETIGISHYRRFFLDVDGKVIKYFKAIIGTLQPVHCDQLDRYLKNYDIIVPEKFFCGDKSLEEQYRRNHNIEDLLLTRKVIQNKFPEYLESFDYVMKQNKMSMYNMLYTKKELFDCYCEWLFEILFEVEKNVDITEYDTYQARIFGFLSERLFNVWLVRNKHLKVKYLEVYNVEELTRKYAIKKLFHIG